MINYYELLNISKNASDDEIKKAYRTMVKKYHPDINKSPEASKIIVSLNDAKNTLLNPEKRKEYDEILNGINFSKHFSNNKKDSYHSKTQDYKETYSDTYLTRWEYFFSYFKFSKDNFIFKILKTILLSISFFISSIIRLFVWVLIFLIYLFNEVIDFALGILLLIGLIYIISFFDTGLGLEIINPNHSLSFGVVCTLVSLFIIFLKVIIFKSGVNVFIFLRNIEDRILIKLLSF